MTGGSRSTAETSVDSALRSTGQPRNKQGQQEENDTDGDNSDDQHGQLLCSTQLQRRTRQIGYEDAKSSARAVATGVSAERSPNHCP